MKAQSSPGRTQLLGVAFASSDIAFELDHRGLITFALGATRSIIGLDAEAMAGRDWRTLIHSTDMAMIGLVLADLAEGERRGGIRVRLASADPTRPPINGELAVFRLAAPPRRVSCAFHLSPNPSTAPAADALLSRADFEEAVGSAFSGASTGAPLHLDLVELPGFAARAAKLSPSAAERTRQQVVDALRASAYGGFAAAELAPDRFALVRSTEAGRLTEHLRGITGASVERASQDLPRDVDLQQGLRAIRFALDCHIEAGPQAAANVFNHVLADTLQSAKGFTERLAQDKIDLVFQPVVDLRTRGLHHFEALARFEENSSPQDLIVLAEQLDLIGEFDLAVARSVVKTLARGGNTQIAVNLSARSIVEPGFVAKFLMLTESQPELRPRMLVEITETHALQDLHSANILLSKLSDAGHIICLDDFGAGAASLDYLRRLKVDFVKIDGRYIRSLPSEPRDRIIVKHVVLLCRELGISVIAEMIEDEETAKLATQLGASLGQGWLFGRPSGALDWQPPAIPETPPGAWR